MKKTVFPAICILISCILMMLIPTEAEAAIYEDTLRLHILAESDTAEDQAIKIAIRDMVLEKYSSLFANECDISAVIGKANAELGAIENDCNRLILDTGYDYRAKVRLTEEWYETREYRDFLLPAGTYASLIIELGAGEGQNWWCVMYPPMCLEASLSHEEYPYTPSEMRLINKSGYRVKFKILELASEIISGS